MRSPTGVTVTSLLPRSNSGVPSSSSSFWIATDSAGWLTKHLPRGAAEAALLRDRDDVAKLVQASSAVSRSRSRRKRANASRRLRMLEPEVDRRLEVAELAAAVVAAAVERVGDARFSSPSSRAMPSVSWISPPAPGGIVRR